MVPCWIMQDVLNFTLKPRLALNTDLPATASWVMRLKAWTFTVVSSLCVLKDRSCYSLWLFCLQIFNFLVSTLTKIKVGSLKYHLSQRISYHLLSVPRLLLCSHQILEVPCHLHMYFNDACIYLERKHLGLHSSFKHAMSLLFHLWDSILFSIGKFFDF